jgi:FkbM family methyltransferase
MREQWERDEQALRFKNQLSGKPVVCTGGRTYYVIRGDGSLYRCLYNPQVVGNIQDKELPQLSGKGLACSWKNNHDMLVDSCHPSGDLMFASFWEDGQRCEAPWPHWHEPKTPEEDKIVKDKAYFQVLPVNSRCNHACQYCCNFYFETDDGKVIGRPKDHDTDLPLEAWEDFLDNCAKKLEFAHFGFLGGEPMLYRHMPELVALIVNKHGWEVGICSNMSLTRKFKQIAELVDPNRRHLVRFSASLHPSENRGFKWDNYWASVRSMRASGFDVRATMVSWPEQTYLYDELRERLATIDVDLHLKGIGGYGEDKIPGIDWNYIKANDGALETPDYLSKIGWFKKGVDPRSDDAALLQELFKIEDGVFVDIGAGNGSESHTRAFMELGWRGILVEPDPRNIKGLAPLANNKVLLLKKAVHPIHAEADLIMGDDVYNSSLMPGWNVDSNERRKVDCMSPQALAELALEQFGRIDFLKVDAEGLDLDIIRSFPFEKSKPKVVMAEKPKDEHQAFALANHMEDIGYVRKCGMSHNIIWVHPKIMGT